MVDETSEERVVISQLDYEALNELIKKYEGALKEAYAAANKLHAVTAFIMQKNVGQLDVFMEYDNAARKLSLMLGELYSKLSKLNGELQ